MYNRYIPEDMSYTQVEESPSNAHPGVPRNGSPSVPPFRLPDFLSGREGLFAIFEGRSLFPGGTGEGLSGLLKTLHLDKIDSGDILLLLIMLYLLVEGDDLELVIALGLVILMGLGEDREEAE